VPAAEDTLQGIYNFALGIWLLSVPREVAGCGCICATTMPRKCAFRDPATSPDLLTAARRQAASDALFEDVRQIGPLATFGCAHSWVYHPYRDGVALVGDSAASSDPTWGQGLSLTLRDARVLRDHLMRTDDWDAAGHAYAEEHDGYAGRLHTFHQWMSAMYLATGPDADARRARAMPLIAQDPSRQPDALFVGPDLPVDEAARKRFSGKTELARILRSRVFEGF